MGKCFENFIFFIEAINIIKVSLVPSISFITVSHFHYHISFCKNYWCFNIHIIFVYSNTYSFLSESTSLKNKLKIIINRIFFILARCNYLISKSMTYLYKLHHLMHSHIFWLKVALSYLLFAPFQSISLENTYEKLQKVIRYIWEFSSLINPLKKLDFVLK